MSNSIKKFIELGSTITAGFVKVGVESSLGDKYLAEFSGTIVEKTLENIGNDLYGRMLSTREKIRIGAATTFALERIRGLLLNGSKLRDDGFFYSTSNMRSPAEEILEGVYLKSKSSFEEKKIRHYGYFFGYVAIVSQISSAEANYLLNLYEKLTYRQVCILKIYYDFDSYKESLTIKELSIKKDLLLSQEMNELITLHLIIPVSEIGQNITLFGFNTIIPRHIELTHVGKTIALLFDLNIINDDDIVLKSLLNLLSD